MKTANFLAPGLRRDTDKVFFMGRNRQAARNKTVFHRNRYSSVWRIPWDVYQKHFTFDRSTFIYRTNLIYADIKPYLTTIDHEAD